jgi:hypothetical protein
MSGPQYVNDVFCSCSIGISLLVFVPAGLHVGGPDKLSTLVTLEQAVAPRVTPPGPVAHLVRGLCARVVQNLMADLRQEVHRRQELETGDDIQGLLDSWPVV